MAGVRFQKIRLWVQLHGLPRLGMNNVIGSKIGSRVGTVLHFDDTIRRAWSGGAKGEEYMRVRVECDVNKSLPRGVFITVEQEERIWVLFQYERLPTFCFGCGTIGHLGKDCPGGNHLRDEEFQYGDWLRANSEIKHPMRRVQGSVAAEDRNTLDQISTDASHCSERNYNIVPHGLRTAAEGNRNQRCIIRGETSGTQSTCDKERSLQLTVTNPTMKEDIHHPALSVTYPFNVLNSIGHELRAGPICFSGDGLTGPIIMALDDDVEDMEGSHDDTVAYANNNCMAMQHTIVGSREGADETEIRAVIEGDKSAAQGLRRFFSRPKRKALSNKLKVYMPASQGKDGGLGSGKGRHVNTAALAKILREQIFSTTVKGDGIASLAAQDQDHEISAAGPRGGLPRRKL